MRLFPSLATGALALLAAFPVLAQQSPSQAVVPTERIEAHYPMNWLRSTPERQDSTISVRLLPPGATPQNYTEEIDIQRHEGSLEPPRDFINATIVAGQKACEGLQVTPIDERPINGYKAANMRLACTRSQRSGKSGVMMVIAIAGREALHVVQRIWLGPPVGPAQVVPIPDSVVRDWDAFAASVTLCDIKDSTHPCPVK
jgi:hypothetical protein